LEGQTSASFQITTNDLPSTATATISATLGALTANALLEVRAPGVEFIRFNPTVIKGGRPVQCIIRLESPAPAGGAVVTLTKSGNTAILNIPSQVTVPAGQMQHVFTVTTNRVSRSLAVQVTATRGSGSASTILTVRR
ncbi:MAG TPA: hypothetical protein VM328_05405, partial [Fimbriimonadaceae bacterium]|nr:hypothetical protein [Fimbriimonadaceae bacterium]